MAEKKARTATTVPTQSEPDEVQIIHRARGFWEEYSKTIIYIGSAIILIVGGWLLYKNLVKEPQERKANDAVFAIQTSFKQFATAQDSTKGTLAQEVLNGNGSDNLGALKFSSKYSGTAAANLCHYYAGAAYLALKQYDNAIKQLNNFDANDATQIKSRAYGMIGDAYSELKKNDDALEYYKKAADVNEKDEYTSSEFLFRAGAFAESLGKKKEAAELYRKIKDKYPTTEKGNDIDRYLARVGDVNP
jgi:tetratricopeptide (TPR) repeat protein